ncbi:MAG: 3-dehydroquinate synthase [Spirochaetales bacterium]|nr:3-dehydroquinate synthase [Spirochaetales bacterium]
MSSTANEQDGLVVTGSRGSSTIRFGSASNLADIVDPDRTVVVADEQTAEFAPPEFSRNRLAVVARGEPAKNLASLDELYGRFLDMGVGRDWSVVALGGGSVSDLAGFAASTWMRGIDFGFVPTTLLSMVDASVGGKNGIDYRGYKNLVGCFSQPRFVLVDPSLLSSLPEYDMACGFAEAVKHGVIAGEEHLSIVESAVSGSGSLELMIRESIAFKAAIASRDEREAGDRRKLNLGHTIGHGVETLTGLPHGACVATGIVAAFGLAIERGGSAVDASRVMKLLSQLGLPLRLEDARRASPDTSELSPAVFRDAVSLTVSTDKKRIGADVLFAVPMAVGDVRIEPIPVESIRDFIRRAP